MLHSPVAGFKTSVEFQLPLFGVKYSRDFNFLVFYFLRKCETVVISPI